MLSAFKVLECSNLQNTHRGSRFNTSSNRFRPKRINTEISASCHVFLTSLRTTCLIPVYTILGIWYHRIQHSTCLHSECDKHDTRFRPTVMASNKIIESSNAVVVIVRTFRASVLSLSPEMRMVVVIWEAFA